MIKTFEFSEFKSEKVIKTFKQEEDRTDFARAERDMAKSVNFEISNEIKERRKIADLERAEDEQKFNQAVDAKVLLLKDKIMQSAMEEGRKVGKEDALKYMMQEAQNNLEILKKMLGDLIQNHAKLIENQKEEILILIKNLTKWIILKEVDRDYIGRLLEKLILELKSKSNLVIQINKDDFKDIPELYAAVEKEVGSLSNVRIEEHLDVDKFGLIVKSENGIIKANLNDQFNVLDKVFEVNG